MKKKEKIIGFAAACAVGLAFGSVTAHAEEAGSADAPEGYGTKNVVVTAGRSEEQISDVPADVVLISQSQIERGNYKTVSDALKGADINVVKKGFSAYPIINGDSRVLVLVDGKKVNWDHLVVSGDDNAVDVDQIPMDNVQRIEIVRGPNSSLYGERAMGGVVNIITKRAKKGPLQGTVNAEYGSWGSWRTSVSAMGGDAENRFKVSLARSQSGNYEFKNKDGRKLTFPDSYKSHTDVTVGFDHAFGDDLLSLDFSRNESKDGFGNYLTDVDIPQAYGQGDRIDQINTSYGITYNFDTKSKGFGTFLRYYRNQSKDNSPFAGTPYRHDLKRDTFEGQKIWDITDDNSLVGGFLWSEDKFWYDNDGSEMDRRAVTKALFFEDDWRFKHGFSVKFGTRYEHHSDFGGDFASHISLNKKFDRRTHAYISWGQGINNPTLQMRYADTPYMKGNRDLEQEKSQTFTIGADSQLSKKWNVSASAYWSKVDDALNWVWGPLAEYGGRSYTRYYNVDTEHRCGLELSARYAPSKEWQIRAAYSYAHVESTDPNKAYLSNNTRPNGYLLGLSYTKGPWSGDLDLTYVTGRSRSRFSDSRYLTLDLGVNYQVSDRLKLYLKGNNLTDESYESIGNAIIGAYAMPGRSFTFGATYKF